MSWLVFWGNSFIIKQPLTFLITLFLNICTWFAKTSVGIISMIGLLWHTEYHLNEDREEKTVQRKDDAVNYCTRFTVLVSACLLKCYTRGSQTLKLLKPLTLTKRHSASRPPQSALPVKGIDSLWSVWWSFILSPRQINSLMIDIDSTCMKKPFIYSWNLICSVLWSDAFNRK